MRKNGGWMKENGGKWGEMGKYTWDAYWQLPINLEFSNHGLVRGCVSNRAHAECYVCALLSCDQSIVTHHQNGMTTKYEMRKLPCSCER